MAAGLLLILVLSCGGRRKVAETAPVRAFPTVRVPALLTDDGRRGEYMVLHGWDGFADTSARWRTDSTHIDGVERGEMESAFCAWRVLLDAQPQDVVEKGVRNLVGRMRWRRDKVEGSNFFEGLRSITDRYLFDPDSPYRDEDYYHPFCALMLEEDLPEVVIGHYRKALNTCRRNPRGSVAPDFCFCDRRGRAFRLHAIRAPYTLLFFSNPGCTACKEIIDVLMGPGSISGAVAEGKLAVANVYIDEDLTAWLDYAGVYPDSWKSGYDPNLVIRTDTLYDVRAIPSLYLLDKDKRILLKDAPLERVCDRLEKLLE